MVCPNCGIGGPVGTACAACGYVAPTPPADQFGTPMPSGLSGYAPPPTMAQLYPDPTAPVYAPQPGVAAYPQPGPAGYPGYPIQPPPYESWAVPRTAVGNTYSIIGMVLGVLALFLAPLFIGFIGATMAQQGHRRGERLWLASLITALSGLVIGMLLRRADLLSFLGLV